ncbi:MAG: hypothetical protein KF753_10525 [Caldilineaceae bacterium]|nr:hypothetical protein [Caldilineaceae bacterium]
MQQRNVRFALLFCLSVLLLAGCQPGQFVLPPPPVAAAPTPAVTVQEAKIQSAMEAAPPVIAESATVVDWPAAPGAEQAILRAGSDEWVCMPDWPATPANDPMCLDPTWSAWMQAFMTGAEPEVTTLGVAYMLAGGAAASNTDPAATEPADGEEWVVPPPHVMLLMPGGFDAAVYGTDYTSGKPWILWDETPYEFLIVPVVPVAEAAGPIAVTDSVETKIRNIEAAAPAVIADNAMLMDWPTEAGGEMTPLRAGTNEWLCVPDWPATPPDDPMCFDPAWTAWMGAFMTGAEPEIDTLGVSYMLAGGAMASSSDPFATQPADGEDWVVPPSHVMLIMPGGFDAAVFGTDDTSGKPWIVWDETPFEFLIVPVQ